MPFQPFGYRFEVRSALPPDEVKAAIRARKRAMFDGRGGARGWIAGPFINLVASRDRNAPMLVGRILRDGSGTRMSGRAGYVSGFVALILSPMLFLFLCLFLTRDGVTPAEILILVGLVAGMTILVSAWANHRDADPLVGFLRKASENPGKVPKQQPVVLPAAGSFLKSLTLEESGSVMDGPVTPSMVRESLQDIDGDGFVILSSANEYYIQTVPEFDGYIVEKREGDDEHHYRAARHGSSDEKDVFTFEETLTIFLAYGTGAAMPSFLEWKKIRV